MWNKELHLRFHDNRARVSQLVNLIGARTSGKPSEPNGAFVLARSDLGMIHIKRRNVLRVFQRNPAFDGLGRL